ncbi:MAG: tetratricopeptide repeat protein [Gemmatimonadaceae bacterium]
MSSPTQAPIEHLDSGETSPPDPSIRPPSARVLLALCFGAIALVLAAYSNSLHNGFHFDDSHIIAGNVFIRDLRNIPHFFTDARTFSAIPANAAYRPLVSVTLAADYWLSKGLDPFWFHVTQLTLLLVTGALLFLLYLKLFQNADPTPRHYWAALFAATLFCVHTGNTQAVNYISVRSELLSGLGVLGSFVLYMYWPRGRRYYLYLLPFTIGAFAKTPAVMFAPLLVAYVLLMQDQLSVPEIFSRKAWPQVRRALFETAPAFALAVGLYFFIEGHNAPTLNNGGAGRGQYLLTQTWMWVRYVRLFFLPTGLSADTDLGLITRLAGYRVITGIVLVLISVIAIWRASASREFRPVAFGLSWFWIALVPASSIFPLQEVTNDHRMFFPFMGLTAAVVWGIRAAVARLHLPEAVRKRLPQIALVSAVLVLGIHALGTHRRNRVWLNYETLWHDVVENSPRNPRGLMNYGVTQMAQGKYLVAQDLFKRAYALSPNYPILHINLAVVADAMGDTASAEAWFQKSLAADPNSPSSHWFFGNWLVRHGHGPEAITQLEKAVELSQADMNAQHSLLDVYAARGDSARLRALALKALGVFSTDSVALSYLVSLGGPSAEPATQWIQRGLAQTTGQQYLAAAFSFRMALSTDSTNADAWNNLGWALGSLGFIPEAVAAIERAIRLRPNWGLAQNNLAWAKRLSFEGEFRQAGELQSSGQVGEAIAAYRALLAKNPGLADAHYNLGLALMSTNQCPAAIDEFEKTLSLQPSYIVAHLHLSACLEQVGRTREAATHRLQYASAAATTPESKGPSPASR